MLRIAAVGDVHGRFSAADVRLLDAGGYDLIAFVGDLSTLRWSTTLAVARQIARLRTPTLVVPGNHDASHPVQLLGEVAGRPGVGRPFTRLQGVRLHTLAAALAPHALGAYSSHGVGDVTVIAGRPHSMGGPRLAFAPHLAATWGVASMEASAERLVQLVDAAPTERLVFVAHNGPTGLGDRRADIWGCDFRASEGDWGDADLRVAIDHARARGRAVLAVIAGHMHRALRGGGTRTWMVEERGTLYVNAACVPRVTASGHHHVALTIDGEAATAEDRHCREEA